MIPLTVTARLASAPLVSGPILLDGILVAGMGARLGRAHPSGYADPAEVYAAPLPLARVELDDGRWWYAASQATPRGPEQLVYGHRRPSYEMIERWTDLGTVNHSAGPDKALRVPLYRRSGWTVLTWTCIGDQREIASLLLGIGYVGKRGTHGYGQVASWDVSKGGPVLDAYRSDPTVRHVPIDTWTPGGGLRVRRHDLPLTPPYHQRARAVPCWQVPEVRDGR